MKSPFIFRIFCRIKNLRRTSRRLGLLVVLALMGSHSASVASLSTSLPTPLSDFDVVLYERLFSLQQDGKMKQATREMGRLRDPMLMGHLLSQR